MLETDNVPPSICHDVLVLVEPVRVQVLVPIFLKFSIPVQLPGKPILATFRLLSPEPPNASVSPTP